MRLLFFGDVVGRAGRVKLFSSISKIRTQLNIDFCIVNVENSAHGFGVTPDISDQFLKHDIDVLTTGDHIWDKEEIKSYIDKENRLIKPANYLKIPNGLGYNVYSILDQKILVINLLGTLFINKSNISNPFVEVDNILNKYKLGVNVDVIFIDFHAEATSEKMAFAHYVDGRVSAVIGTHTHIPTGDAHILTKGTAYQTDAGMCGDYNSSIGMDKQVSIERFVTPTKVNKLVPAEASACLCGVIIDIGRDGLATNIESFRFGTILKETHNLN